MENARTRNSSIELLKIFAMFGIVLCHILSSYAGATVSLSAVTTEPLRFIMVLIMHLGAFGNNIFIIGSAWFLIDTDKVSNKKCVGMWGDMLFFSVSVLLCFWGLGCDIPKALIIQQFLPLSFGPWFILCYLLFYIVHPYLNCIINSISQRQLLILNIFFIIFYGFVSCVIPYQQLYYTNLVGFIGVYFLTAYVKKYLVQYSNSIKCNLIGFTIGSIGLIALLLLHNVLGLLTGFATGKLLMWNAFKNPFIVLQAMCIFNLFRKKEFYTKTINVISSVMMIVFIVHHNNLVRIYLYPYFNDFILGFSEKLHILGVFIIATIVFLISTLIGLVYRMSLQKIIKKVAEKITVVFECVGNKIVDVALKLK